MMDKLSAKTVLNCRPSSGMVAGIAWELEAFSTTYPASQGIWTASIIIACIYTADSPSHHRGSTSYDTGGCVSAGIDSSSSTT